jgi:hypothetical protein
MTVRVPTEAYAAYARGELSHSELLGLEKMASDMSKTALNISPQSLASLGGLLVAAPTLSYAGAQIPEALQSAESALMFNRDLRRVVAVNPQLGSPEDPNLRMAFKTLRSVNPEYSKDPLIAGTILDMVMTNRMDPDDPTSPPRFDPALLQSIQSRGNPAVDAARQAGAKSTAMPLSAMLAP